MADKEKLTIKCANPGCGKEITFIHPGKAGKFSVKCKACGSANIVTISEEDLAKTSVDKPAESADAEIMTVRCTNPECGSTINIPKPAPGRYNVRCPQCQHIIDVNIADKSDAPKPKLKIGRQPDGTYLFRCDNPECGQMLRLRPDKLGEQIKCPKCKNISVYTDEEAMLKCTVEGCDGHIIKPGRGDGLYPTECDKCHTHYQVLVNNGIVRKASQVRPTEVFDENARTSKGVDLSPYADMQVVVGRMFNKMVYNIERQITYIGRHDPNEQSDICIMDSTVSRRSVRIDLEGAPNAVCYKLTVVKSTNPVYQNGQMLHPGDIIYLNYGDTLTLGQTQVKFIKRVQ